MKVNDSVDLLEVFGDREKEIIMNVLEKYQVNRIVDIKKIDYWKGELQISVIDIRSSSK